MRFAKSKRSSPVQATLIEGAHLDKLEATDRGYIVVAKCSFSKKYIAVAAYAEFRKVVCPNSRSGVIYPWRMEEKSLTYLFSLASYCGTRRTSQNAWLN